MTNALPPLPRRLPNWPLHLEALLAQRMAAPFAWGRNDCGTFAADCVRAMTGRDPLPAGLRKHATARQAYRAVLRHGGYAAIADAALGPRIAPALATVGDVLLVKVGKADAFAICNGSTALGPSAAGLISVAVSSATLAWRVA